MNNKDWQKVKEKLSYPYGRVVLYVDGYHLSLIVESVGHLKFGIVPYVDGEIKGKWLSDDSDIGRRFYHHRSVKLHKNKDLKLYADVYGRDSKKYKEISQETVTYWAIWFNSFITLKRHLIKNNTKIELVDE